MILYEEISEAKMSAFFQFWGQLSEFMQITFQIKGV